MYEYTWGQTNICDSFRVEMFAQSARCVVILGKATLHLAIMALVKFGWAQKCRNPPSSPMSLCMLDNFLIIVLRITIQAFSSNASKTHSSSHCLQARCIDSSF